MRTDSKEELPISAVISSTNKTQTSSSRLWSGLKDPRIVRVSRAFGGKDRHSKVTTIRGLRDRRVRLSVPTAIQLYDLQDRLGLNQPSKVVDWLLNAARDEIDKLPPLDFPAVNFLHFHQHSEASPKAKHVQRDQNLDHEGEHQMEGFAHGFRNDINAASSYPDVGICNAHSSLHQDHMLPNGRTGSQASGLFCNIGIPSSSFCHWDSSSRGFFSEQGILSSSALPSNYYTTAAPCDMDGRQLSFLQMGVSPQQNLSPSSNTMLRSSFHPGSPKARTLGRFLGEPS